MRRLVGTVTLFLLVATVGPSWAQEGHGHEHRHEVAFFAGATYEADREKNFATLGGEYEFKIHPRLGVGAGLEYVADIDAALLVFPFTFHLGGGFSLVAAPGLEIEPRHESDSHGARSSSESETGGDETDFLTRLGAQYAVGIGGRYAVVPHVAIDFVDRGDRISRAWVYGAKFAIGF